MRVKRSDLRKLLKPMVKEFVEEAVEELITEGYINKVIQESVLKGDVIGHVITEVFKGFQPIAQQGVIQPQQRRQAQVREVVQEDDDAVLERINQLSQNTELSEMLRRRKNSYNKMDEQLEQQTQQQGPKRVDWRSAASAVPPDDPSVGLQAPVKGNLSEVSAHINPLRGTVGSGIDTEIINELNPKAIWPKDKLNRFLNMRPQQVQTWSKASLDQIAGRRLPQEQQ